ncbi:unnamed protein product, partial [Amoebophrya sp. A25]
RKAETNLLVDLMLDLNFKRRLGELFTRLYKRLVTARLRDLDLQDQNELGDFTCQIFTRADVTQGLVTNLAKAAEFFKKQSIPFPLREAIMPRSFRTSSRLIRESGLMQCSLDLLYVLDHRSVAKELLLKSD